MQTGPTCCHSGPVAQKLGFEQGLDVKYDDWYPGLAYGITRPGDATRERLEEPPRRFGLTVTEHPFSLSTEGGLQDHRLDDSSAMAIDSRDRVFIADGDANCIRTVSPDGSAVVYAGQAEPPPPRSEQRSTSYGMDLAGLAIGPDGTIYFSDRANHRICRVTDAAGGFAVVAGSDEGSEDGPAQQARFSRPSAIACGSDGTLYVADSENRLLRCISPNGIVSTLAGEHPEAPNGARRRRGTGQRHSQIGNLSVDGQGRVLYVEAGFETTLYRLEEADQPTALAALSPLGYDRWRTRDHPRPLVAWMLAPHGMAIAEDGSLIGLDPGRQALVRIRGNHVEIEAFPHLDAVPDPVSGSLFMRDAEGFHFIRLPQGGGANRFSGLSRCFPRPEGYVSPGPLAFDAAGRLYLMDAGAGRIYRFDPDGRRQVAFELLVEPPQDGPRLESRFYRPMALVINRNDEIFVAEPYRHRIRRIGPDGRVSTLVQWNPDDPILAGLPGPASLAIDESDRLYAFFTASGAIVSIQPDGREGVRLNAGKSFHPLGDPAIKHYLYAWSPFVATPDGGFIIVDEARHGLRVVSAKGEVRTIRAPKVPWARPTGTKDFSEPRAIALSPDGWLLLAIGDRIGRLEADGTLTTITAGGFRFDAAPWTIDRHGAIWRIDEGATRLTRIAPSLSSEGASEHLVTPPRRRYHPWCVSTQLGGRGAGTDTGPAPRFCRPSAIAVSPTGESIVSDSSNDRLVRLPKGDSFPLNRPMLLDGPQAVSYGEDGTVYFSVRYERTLGRLSPEGTLTSQTDFLQDGVSLRYDVKKDAFFLVGTYGGCTPVPRASIEALGPLPPREEMLYGSCHTRVHAIEPDGACWVSRWDEPAGPGPVQLVRISVASQVLAGGPLRPLGRAARDPVSGAIVIAQPNASSIARIDPDGWKRILAGGLPGFCDGPADEARFEEPVALVADRHGELYVVDRGNHSIRQVSPSGEVTTIAGGEAGYQDGPGDAARFWSPSGIALGGEGTLLVADTGNHVIRRLSRQPSTECSEVPHTTPRRLQSPGQLVGRELEAFHADTSEIVLFFAGSQAIIIGDNPQHIPEFKGSNDRNDEAYDRFDARQLIGSAISAVVARCVPSAGMPYLDELRFSNGKSLFVSSDVGSALLEPEWPTPFALNVWDEGEPVMTWMALVGRQIRHGEHAREGIRLWLDASDEANIDGDLDITIAKQAPCQTSAAPTDLLNGAVIKNVTLTFTVPGSTDPAEVEIALDSGTTLSLRRNSGDTLRVDWGNGHTP